MSILSNRQYELPNFTIKTYSILHQCSFSCSQIFPVVKHSSKTFSGLLNLLFIMMNDWRNTVIQPSHF